MINHQEAIKRMESVREYLCAGNPIWNVDEMREVFDMAISALQAQDSPKPTAGSVQNVQNEDLISRKAAIDAVEHITSSMSVCVNTDECHGMKRMQRQAVIELANLPSAEPEPCEDAVSREAAIDVAENAFSRGLLASPDIRKLPSVQPELQWIPVSERLPEPRVDVWVNSDIGQIQGYYEEHIGIWYASFGQGRDYLELIVTAWMPLPEPYRAERRTDEGD